VGADAREWAHLRVVLHLRLCLPRHQIKDRKAAVHRCARRKPSIFVKRVLREREGRRGQRERVEEVVGVEGVCFEGSVDGGREDARYLVTVPMRRQFKRESGDR
jgi:hypothetical protein